VSGGVVEGDFLAGEAFEFGDELVFAALGCEAVVPVGAGVGEAGAGVGEQVPADGEDGVADGDQGAFLAAALDDPLVTAGQELADRCQSVTIADLSVVEPCHQNGTLGKVARDKGRSASPGRSNGSGR
jgi:hypothetical protein